MPPVGFTVKLTVDLYIVQTGQKEKREGDIRL